MKPELFPQQDLSFWKDTWPSLYTDRNSRLGPLYPIMLLNSCYENEVLQGKQNKQRN